MLSSKVVLALALVCVALIPACSAVTKCIVCDSTTTPHCLYGNTTSAPCTGTNTHCIKEVRDEGEDNEIVKRLCGNESGRTCPTNYECHYCDEDDCNSAYTISKSLPVIGLSVFAAYILSRFNH